MLSPKNKIWSLVKIKVRSRWLIISLVGCAVSALLIASQGYEWKWTVIREIESISITTEKDIQGNVIKTVETVTPKPGKTLWDLFSLLGVPVSLTILGYWLQQQLQKQTAEEAKEEVLQVYFDRVSALLTDKNILAIATNIYSSEEEVAPGQREMLDAAINVIQARTLSVLRRFKDDGERKGDVVRFLIDSGVIGKTEMSLKSADLKNANLCNLNLRGVNLRCADLANANLIKANLKGADLAGADLRKANLGGAQLNGTCFELTNLSEATINLLTEVECAKFAYAVGLSEAQKANLKERGATFELEKMIDVFDLP